MADKTATTTIENAQSVFNVASEQVEISHAGVTNAPSIHLKTAKKYVDKDIHVNGAVINVPAAEKKDNAIKTAGWLDAGTQLCEDGSAQVAAAVEVTNPSVSVDTSVTGIATTSTNTGYSVESVTAATNGIVNGTAKATATGTLVKAGYIDGDNDIADDTTGDSKNIVPNVTHANKKYLATKTIAAEVNSLTQPSVAVSGTLSSKVAQSASETDYYVTINGSGTNGSVKAKATSAGAAAIVEANASNTSAASTITPSITGNGDKIYIQASSVVNPSSVPSGKTSTTISSGSVIEVKPGYYDQSRYFKAQDASDTANAEFGAVSGGYGITSPGYAASQKLLDTAQFGNVTGGYGATSTGYVEAGKLIDNAKFTNAPENGISYETKNTPELIAKDYLYVTAGYIPSSWKISLADLIPGDVTVIDSANIRVGTTAYDGEGSVVVGTMQDYDGAYSVEIVE